MKKEKYIMCVDDKYWRVKVRIGKRYFNKCFSFSRGNKKTALTQAKLWRDNVLIDHGLLFRLEHKKSPDIFKDNPAGPIIGVYRNWNPSTARWNWIARYSVNGIEHKRSFSVEHYGEREAYTKACQVRFSHAGTLVVVDRNAIPCMPTVPHVIGLR